MQNNKLHFKYKKYFLYALHNNCKMLSWSTVRFFYYFCYFCPLFLFIKFVATQNLLQATNSFICYNNTEMRKNSIFLLLFVNICHGIDQKEGMNACHKMYMTRENLANIYNNNNKILYFFLFILFFFFVHFVNVANLSSQFV